MAKGICYGRGVKLIAVPTLELMAVPVLLGEHPEEEDALVVPMLDARRMEVYAEVLDRALKVVRPIQADIVDADTYKEYLDQHHVYFFGNGAAKCMETINHPNAHLVEGIEPLAKNMAPLAENVLRGQVRRCGIFRAFLLSRISWLRCQRNCSRIIYYIKYVRMNIEGLDYNTQRAKLILPEYGRENSADGRPLSDAYRS